MSIPAVAARAAGPWAAMPPAARAAALRGLARALDDHRDELVGLAEAETGLGRARLDGELTRTAVQLRLLSDVVASGEHLDARIDEADPGFVLGPRPDLRRHRVPLGPVLNFAAGNFPFAFSVAGGDTASALAAGCPVIVKTHPGHPRTSARTAELASAALAAAGAPDGTLQTVGGDEEALAILDDPAIAAGSFTGSTRVGRMLADRAAARPAPIPFYGELGSVNPVFVTPAAIRERGPRIIQGLVAALSGSAGQLCTKPGYVFLPRGHGLEGELASALAAMPEHRLLTPRISHSFIAGRAMVLGDEAVDTVRAGSLRTDDDGHAWATPTLARIAAGELLARPHLVEEVFGPLAVLVEYEEGADLVGLADQLFEGSLAVAVHAGGEDDVRPLLDWAAAHSGRVILDGWPTGVSVTPAQQHGGPWPATTLDLGTSVGTAAIARFQRAVAYQDVPEDLLPEPLQDANPWGVPQRRSPAGESAGWGAAGG